jgi:hypothetical protein
MTRGSLRQMKVHEIGALLTFNNADFKRYPEITAWTPEEVLAR